MAHEREYFSGVCSHSVIYACIYEVHVALMQSRGKSIKKSGVLRININLLVQRNGAHFATNGKSHTVNEKSLNYIL